MITLLTLLACGSGASELPCDDDAKAIADGLTCADAKIPTRWLRLVAGRPLPAGSTAAGVAVVHERHASDPAGTRAWLDDLRARGQALEAADGLRAAEMRSAAAWALNAGESPITRDIEPLWNLVGPALSIRETHDGERLALTEADIEGWIQYASLCHEAEGQGVLRVSIAHRADVYRMVSERFDQGSRDEKIALTAFGGVWDAVRARWSAASAERQQAWIADAPLPGGGAATSLAYIESVIEGDVAAHASTLHRHLGPLSVRDGDGWFGASP